VIVEFLTFGNELLDGRRIDTNTAWIGRFLAGYGLEARYRQTTQDRLEDIKASFQLALSRSDLIISTGGLGPTLDDITFEGLAVAVNVPLEYRADIFAGIEKKYAARGIPCPPSNKRQAMLPKGSVAIEAVGTAPGVYMEIDGKMIFCFPGVPHEMEAMVKTFLADKLKTRTFKPVTQIGYSISGIAEAVVEEKILEKGLDKNSDAEVSIAYTASPYTVDVTFSVLPNDPKNKDQVLKNIDLEFRQLFQSNLIKWNDKPIEQHIVQWFLDQKWTLSLAESITGGLITSSLVNVPGCSNMMDRGLVTYSYPSKMDLLGVEGSTLEQHGAVSAQCVLEMARGLLKKSKTQIGLSICGIAGPGGSTAEKPLGLTYICWVGPALDKERLEFDDLRTYVKSTDFLKKVGPNVQNTVMVKKTGSYMIDELLIHDELGFAKVQGFVFAGDRKRNRMLAANQALMGLHTFCEYYKSNNK
jgi:nicotinamide-nucleotide amidase